MKVDYDTYADLYEYTRDTEPIVYSMLIHLLKPTRDDKLLDFGCGTGNYLYRLKLDYGIEAYGIEPAIKMRKIAEAKLPNSCILDGNHKIIPFPQGYFNKIYVTDVIHHVHELEVLFYNLAEAAATNAKLCICTESAAQLCEKYWIKYFPEIATADLQRFHRIEDIVKSGRENGWIHKKTVTTEEETISEISHNFMERVRQKTLSVFHLISNEAYAHGLSLMEADYHKRVPIHQCEGYTFILFERQM